MNNSKVLLFLNGEIPELIPDSSNYDVVFCTDGAYHYLKNFNIQPDIISGDFDSIELEQFPNTIEIISTPDQNDTDFVKALQLILDKGFRHVDVFGASGKQQDHFMGNLNAAYRFKNQMEITFFDNHSQYFFAKNKTILEGKMGQTISLIPFPTCQNISTKGLEFPLNNEDLSLISRIGTRNKAIDDYVEIEFKKGDLVIFIINRNFPILLT